MVLMGTNTTRVCGGDFRRIRLPCFECGKRILLLLRNIPRSPQDERRLIRQAKKQKEKAHELVLRHIGFLIFRICKRTFPQYVQRFGDDILTQTIFMLYVKIKTYNLRYYDALGNFKPVRFVSYIWKAADGHILACLRKELERERIQPPHKGEADWRNPVGAFLCL